MVFCDGISASSVISNSTLSSFISVWYCFTRLFFGSFSTRTSASSSSGSKHCHNRDTAHQLRNQAKAHQVVRLHQTHSRFCFAQLGVLLQLAAKAQRRGVRALLDMLFSPSNPRRRR